MAEAVSVARVRVSTPVGEMLACARDGKLCFLEFTRGRNDPVREAERRFGPVSFEDGADPLRLREALDAYFAGDLTRLDDVPVDAGGTPFQQAVWSALRRIPVGTTVSYADLARTVGAPAAVRAVGAANGRNPVAIVVPCHRVVRSDGSLGGYGGGLATKRWLLEHEKAALQVLRAPVQRGLFGPRPEPWEEEHG